MRFVSSPFFERTTIKASRWSTQRPTSTFRLPPLLILVVLFIEVIVADKSSTLCGVKPCCGGLGGESSGSRTSRRRILDALLYVLIAFENWWNVNGRMNLPWTNLIRFRCSFGISPTSFSHRSPRAIAGNARWRPSRPLKDPWLNAFMARELPRPRIVQRGDQQELDWPG
jgi:hypothetical protein